MMRLPAAAALLALALPAVLHAQAAPDAFDSAPRAALALRPSLTLDRPEMHRAGAPASAARTVLYTVGGTVVGAWVGFVASQVARSDWDKSSDDQFSSYRLRFAAGGAVLGGTLAAVLTHHHSRSAAHGPVPASGSGARPAWAGSRGDAITHDEIANSGARDAYDLVAGLRPTWLHLRGDATFHDSPNGTVSGGPGAVSATLMPGDGGPKVYLNTGLLGDVTTLHDIPLVSLTEVRFLTPAEASYRFGHGYPDGVILLSTEAKQ